MGATLVPTRRLLTARASLVQTEHTGSRRRGQRSRLPAGERLVSGYSLLLCASALPGSGIEPVPSALAGRFFTTEPPGKPLLLHFMTSDHSQ